MKIVNQFVNQLFALDRAFQAEDLGVLTPEDIKVLDRHYAQVFGTTSFLHQSATSSLTETISNA